MNNTMRCTCDMNVSLFHLVLFFFLNKYCDLWMRMWTLKTPETIKTTKGWGWHGNRVSLSVSGLVRWRGSALILFTGVMCLFMWQSLALWWHETTAAAKQTLVWFIHYLEALILRGSWREEPIPAGTGWEVGYMLDRQPSIAHTTPIQNKNINAARQQCSLLVLFIYYLSFIDQESVWKCKMFVGW